MLPSPRLDNCRLHDFAFVIHGFQEWRFNIQSMVTIRLFNIRTILFRIRSSNINYNIYRSCPSYM